MQPIPLRMLRSMRSASKFRAGKECQSPTTSRLFNHDLMALEIPGPIEPQPNSWCLEYGSSFIPGRYSIVFKKGPMRVHISSARILHKPWTCFYYPRADTSNGCLSATTGCHSGARKQCNRKLWWFAPPSHWCVASAWQEMFSNMCGVFNYNHGQWWQCLKQRCSVFWINANHHQIIKVCWKSNVWILMTRHQQSAKMDQHASVLTKM